MVLGLATIHELLLTAATRYATPATQKDATGGPGRSREVLEPVGRDCYHDPMACESTSGIDHGILWLLEKAVAGTEKEAGAARLGQFPLRRTISGVYRLCDRPFHQAATSLYAG